METVPLADFDLRSLKTAEDPFRALLQVEGFAAPVWSKPHQLWLVSEPKLFATVLTGNGFTRLPLSPLSSSRRLDSGKTELVHILSEWSVFHSEEERVSERQRLGQFTRSFRFRHRMQAFARQELQKVLRIEHLSLQRAIANGTLFQACTLWRTLYIPSEMDVMLVQQCRGLNRVIAGVYDEEADIAAAIKAFGDIRDATRVGVETMASHDTALLNILLKAFDASDLATVVGPLSMLVFGALGPAGALIGTSLWLAFQGNASARLLNTEKIILATERFRPPTLAIPRTVRYPIEICGVHLSPGEIVMCIIPPLACQARDRSDTHLPSGPPPCYGAEPTLCIMFPDTRQLAFEFLQACLPFIASTPTTLTANWTVELNCLGVNSATWGFGQ